MSKFEKQFSNLANPKNFKENLDITGLSTSFLKENLNLMQLIRLVEEKLAYEKEKGEIGGPVHLGAGQEAIAAGVSANLSGTDKVFGAHRSHSHLLGLNNDIRSLFAEILGKDTGFSKGMGGSMHLSDFEHGFVGSVPIVSGTVPLAVGAAFSGKMMGNDNISVAYLGDGAVEEGIVHESLNLARVVKSPTLFIVEHNLFSSHMHISLRQPFNSTTRFAEANGIEFVLLDGNDFSSIFTESKNFIDEMRKDKLPRFIEAVTYRHFGHVDFRRDIDVGVNRSTADLENWMARDPIRRLENTLLDNKIIDKDYLAQISDVINDKINKAWEAALKDPYPGENELLDRVFIND